MSQPQQVVLVLFHTQHAQQDNDLPPADTVVVGLLAGRYTFASLSQVGIVNLCEDRRWEDEKNGRRVSKMDKN